jgi:CPA2 family monovalent cation:H+ antiporter-2
MHHETALIALIVVGFGCALAGGLFTARIGLPPLVGYLLAGVVVGPFTPGFSGDPMLAHQLAEIGVVLLMFGVGMHVSLKDLLAVKSTVLPCALVGFVVPVALGVAIAFGWGWSPGAGVVLGLALSVTSTVVLLRALDERGLVSLPVGRLAIGWLVVEDILSVLLLVGMPTLAQALQQPDSNFTAMLPTLGLTLGKVVGFVAFMLLVGSRVLPWLLDRVSQTGSRELFTLAVTTIALGVGFGCSELLGLSNALGAFFAGVVVNGSDHNKRAMHDTEPLQDIFAVLFFVAVGMLFNPVVLVQRPVEILLLLAVVSVAKPVVTFLLLKLFRADNWTAATIGVGLGQIGEFSFILVAVGVSLNLLPQLGQDLILATALLAITLNPLLFRLVQLISPQPRRLEA